METDTRTQTNASNIDMLDNKPVRIESSGDIYFHRNGIGGQPFWTVKFTYGELNMVATMGVEEDSVILSSCRVLCLESIVDSLWRGDKFAPILLRQMSAIFNIEGLSSSRSFVVRSVRNVRSD
tara:strand:- start:819 stop:1187 length:369 start_codon:yes stop_codon:yes gene_type:complete